LLLLALALLALGRVPAAAELPHAETPPDFAQAKIRAAVERALPFIEKGGVDWMEKHECNSCHVVAFVVWSHREAAGRGLPVDRKKLDAWTDWALADARSDRYWFKLRPRVMEDLKTDGVPAPVLAKLQPLVGKSHVTEKAYVEAVTKALGPEEAGLYKADLVRRGTLPNNGGGPDTLAQLLLGRGSLAEAKPVSDGYETVRKMLLAWQEPNGSWNADGQLPALKWENDREMNEATTMWSLLALSGSAHQDELTRNRQLALAFLAQSSPGKSAQSVALHALVAHLFGDPARAEKLRLDLLARQQPDGGWKWVPENTVSDAFSTGQALYALSRLGPAANAEPIRRASEFLLRTQSADGGWEVPQELINRRPRKLNMYPLWGSAWAVIGLLQTLPPTAAP
jgi:hypothetical protein